MSNSAFDMIMELASGQAGETLSQRLGANPDQIKAASAAAIPALFGALQRNASSADGAASLFNALQKDHDGSALANPTGFLKGLDVASGAGILKHVFGGKQGQVEQGIGKSSGLDAGTVGQLMAMLAPMVMGSLGKQVRSENLGTSGLQDMLGQERKRSESKTPGIEGMLGSLLDRDGDGNMMDDIAEMGMGLLGKMMKR